ncbi:uncharacterized protein LOC113305534 [Papaver somniferum]|uniref:uncharacterized protein LOC113305534 n=1 Tax=Papaver somniferum TaxID=3469 RepID=UPI000E6FA763|nr:uncharacterized protein LOC113305534 [Papaver somniferum]
MSALYGLKQALRAWFHRFPAFLLNIGFKSSHSDHSMFIKHSSVGILILLLYVDDIIITGSDTVGLQNLFPTLQQEFSMTYLRDLHYFLGLEATGTKDGLVLTQNRYTLDLSKRIDLTDWKPVSAPVSPRSKLSSNDVDLFPDITLYRSLVGGLQYLNMTRPDITYTVNQVSQFMHRPIQYHFLDVKHILRYLKGTLSHGISFWRNNPMQLTTFSDADWGGDPDTSRSTTGHCIFLGKNLISWGSKKQPTVYTRSTEAEYRALSSTSAELTWFRYLLHDLGSYLKQPPILYCDNISATYSRSKHIQIHYHFVRERISSVHLQLCYIATTHQLADLVTKGLSNARFRFLYGKLSCCLPPCTY